MTSLSELPMIDHYVDIYSVVQFGHIAIVEAKYLWFNWLETVTQMVKCGYFIFLIFI